MTTTTTPAPADLPASMTRIGTGVYLTPSDAAMTEPELREWLRLRCAPDDVDEVAAELRGKTLDECEDQYAALHGSMA